MKKKLADLKKHIDEINSYSLVTYLKILGHQPTLVTKECTHFASPFNDCPRSTLIIDNITNRFRVTCNVRTGRVIDLARWLFRVSPEDMLADLITYRLDQLLRTNIESEADRP